MKRRTERNGREDINTFFFTSITNSMLSYGKWKEGSIYKPTKKWRRKEKGLERRSESEAKWRLK